MSAQTIGETTYERFRRLLDILEFEFQRNNFLSHIIAKFAELHDLELRDILQECFDRVAQTEREP